MTLKLIRGLWLWGMFLALGVLLVVPFDDGWRVLAAVLVTALVVQGWRRAGRRAGQLRESLRLADDVPLPPAGYRQPVLLVCGDGQDGLFGKKDNERPRLRMTARACYLDVGDTRRLPTLVSALLARRPAWSGQLGVLFVVNPGEQDDPTLLTSQARALAHQLALVRRQQGLVLPLLLASYLRGAQGQAPWFVWGDDEACPQVHEAGSCSALEQWQRQADDSADDIARMRAAVQLNGAAQWWREQVLVHLAGCTPVACAMTFVEALPGERSGNLWQQWLRQRLALQVVDVAPAASSGMLEFPDVALSLMPLRLRATPRQRATVKAIWMFTLAGLVALASSAWNNDRLMRQVTADLHRYASIPSPAHADQPAYGLREEALAVLHRHATLLEYYSSNGEPLSLGFGLYRDQLLRERLLAVLLGHRQPVMPLAVARAPGMVRLDSLSLFSSGSAQLKPRSTKVLVNALVDIKAQPGWLIVIAGHTDATGSDEHNLRLSRARAAAVRDWMQRMGDIPDSCFAIQGFGASQPIASNDHEDGRMSNRRVDIRLLPAEGACLVAPPVAG
ncbi:OmpA family protein [Pseudomonas sp. 148P]|uniref:OmpA family protein n=1 Tax=Pseudomonas ulcerans TaxID=3115852 RepID=A0ABU7HQC7_9PSED|nr:MULTISPECIES: OmpA family protein [unclassified Pseudomonas]MEE1922767.1 OmpA family protein [Pseudomonas sp. 147P]MEE1933744.1 OmpA family protein [Pseudomonas sp. 148P]